MHSRRSLLGLIGAAAGTVSLAGCSVLEDTFEKSASPAGVPESALEETGFEYRDGEEVSFRRTVEALGQSRELRLTNWRVTYGKALEGFGQDGARFQLYSTPSVTVAGTEINPFAGFGDARLLGEVEGEEDEADGLDEESTRTVRTLDEDVTYARYERSRELGGQSVAAYVHVGQFSNEGDLLAAVGVHPEAVDEAENIYRLAEAVEHPFSLE